MWAYLLTGAFVSLFGTSIMGVLVLDATRRGRESARALGAKI